MALSKGEQEYLKRLQSAGASKESMVGLLKKRREKEKAQEPGAIGKTFKQLQNIGAGAIQAGGELAVGLPGQISRLAPGDQSADQNSFFNKTQRLLGSTKQDMSQGGIDTEGLGFGFGKGVMNLAGGSLLAGGAGSAFGKLGLKMTAPTSLAGKTAVSAGRGLKEGLGFDLASGETPGAGTAAGTAIGALIPGAGVLGGALGRTAGAAGGYLSKITPKINTSKVGAYTEKAINVGKGLMSGLKDAGSVIGGNLSRLPSNLKTNAAIQKAEQEVIKKLPTTASKNAVRDGVDIADVRTLRNIVKNIKPQAKQLLKTIKDFEQNPRGTNPIEIVGKPITKKIQQAELMRQKVGAELGKVSEKLPNVSGNEALNSVYNSLKNVSGLKGLKIKGNAQLDFSNTTLATSATAADRKAIQNIFNDAIKSGTGKSKHLLRQELFETLGGKKKSLSSITDTQEKAFDAIRKGLSDLLESKSSGYKSLSNQYRSITQPLSDMRKFMKSLPEATEDILDMQGGLLARRLTSNAASNPQIRQILRNLDKVSGGKSAESVESLQDVYNILDKYYDIAGKTGLKGQVAGDLPTSIKGGVVQSLKGLVGKTDGVTRKAIEDLLEELLF